MDEYGFGSRGPGVQLLQLGLSRAGYQPGRIDGSFGRGIPSGGFPSSTIPASPPFLPPTPNWTPAISAPGRPSPFRWISP